MDRTTDPGPTTRRLIAIGRALDAVSAFLRHPHLPARDHDTHRAEVAEMALDVARTVQRGTDLVTAVERSNPNSLDPATLYYRDAVVAVVEAICETLDAFAALPAARRATVLRVAVACFAAGATPQARADWTAWAVEHVGPSTWDEVCGVHDRRQREEWHLLRDMAANPEKVCPERRVA